MTKKCKSCGSTEVRIDMEDFMYLDADVAAKQASFTMPNFNGTTFCNPRCGKCSAPREDFTDDDIDEIWCWA